MLRSGAGDTALETIFIGETIRVGDYAALRYLYSMQDTSNMLCRRAIARTLYDFYSDT